MQITLGFFLILILIVLPGLIFRRLYFYGEFSKQFHSDYSFIKVLSLSAVPGLVIFIVIYLFYDNFISEIDIGSVIDKLKEINDPSFSFRKSNEIPLRQLINFKASPFIGFLYLTSFLIGALAGRFVRITKLDTKFKLLRFKNYWFYFFNGLHTDFKKMRHLRQKNKKHIFTKADILIDFNNKPELYSGIIEDYELDSNSSNVLSKIVLREAYRYKVKKKKKVPVPIPGSLFVVDCSALKNINLTYVYEDAKSVLDSKIPVYIENAFGLLLVILIPFFIFKSDSIHYSFYDEYFHLSWYKKIIVYLTVAQIISIINPFIKKGDEYQYISFKTFIVKIVILGVLVFLLWLL